MPEKERKGEFREGRKPELGPSGVTLSVMKYAWDGQVIRIIKAVTRFKEGGSLNGAGG
jgi:hypothetical protein